ncbi:transcription-repair coupling factor [Prevotella sp. E13-17]|uniref:transcription-repair coupling factor n=1 Tax=Prevotella sp. E13-17 TaxID=2913616 RepID=UPI001EDB7941|nr:transcription-repair coupling factor [Prevotella sp. E13-17]UKK50427.1 transcription-repair coupling factor [Prevotella sp. E13-17]
MNIQELQTLYAMKPQVAALAKLMEKSSEKTISLDGLLASAAPMLFSALALKTSQRLVFILNDADEAGYFYHDLCQVMGEGSVLFFPSSYRRAIKYGQKDPASEILRTEVLTRLTECEEPRMENRQTSPASQVSQASTVPSSLYVVTYPEALAEMVVTRKQLDARRLTLQQGQTIGVDDVCVTLRDFGFREVDYVYEPGQFALRGSILDVYSYSHEFPFRLDFFGDEIDSIRTFQVEDQLSKERCELVDVVPELTAVEEKESILKFLPKSTLLAMKDFQFVRETIERAYQEGFSAQALQERLEGATELEQRQIEKEMQRDSQIITGSQFARDAEPFRKLLLARAHASEGACVSFNIKPQPLFHKNFELLSQTLEDFLLQGFKLYILADSEKQQERLKDIFAEMKQGITFVPVDKTLHEGFIDVDARLCLFTDHQIFDRFHKYNLKSDKARGGKVALTLKEIQQFEVGDYVVHVDHGIGKFGGLVRMPLQDGGFQEMIKIVYQRGDAIYVSIHSLYKVSKYKSQDDGQQPRMSTLGTGQWERLKERTKKHIKDIARDLIKLYAARKRQKGFAFSHDTYLQHELEASFLYEDTPDQLKATQEVKADMELPKPMDRLVCGDVGFGKTEVAVRAAFKAAVDGKQVAVMVPTTVLAYQHYRTFLGRLKDMPVRVDYLTRARSAKHTAALLKDLADGKVDILIGTQKLISKSVKFKDLGLLIIDEEQKFGVSTKEKLRQMKTNVDTLTMSATPIPRTLQFSLVGARDLSVIQTPPPNRYPIQTEIHTFSAEIITDAINFEMSRNGQVYIVNNRISDLTHIAEMIHKYVPDCRIAIGHGQMKPDELEKIILDFSNYDYDVLLSTTIVENGIDIPNANTIIINSAQYFGLSDLHQMRGRVGRGNRKGFCYLLAPPLAALPTDSRRRLEALENFSDLGSGINIAMQDLDIRGAGNLLGAEQSGFISDLGYETYQKILNEAMAELRNEEPEVNENEGRTAERGDSSRGEKTQSIGAKETSDGSSQFSALDAQADFVADCNLESDLEMYFPDQYVPSDSERMLLYRELDNTRNDQEVEAYRLRLVDRFGPLPPQAEELLQVVGLRRSGKRLGCEKIMLKQGRMFLYFVSNVRSPFYQSAAFSHILDYIGRNVRRCNLREQNGKRSMVVTDVPTVGEAVKVLNDIIGKATLS